MGVAWLTEVISWKAGPPEMWIVTDLVNALTGMLVFIIYICRRKTLEDLRTMFGSNAVCHKLLYCCSSNKRNNSTASATGGFVSTIRLGVMSRFTTKGANNGVNGSKVAANNKAEANQNATKKGSVKPKELDLNLTRTDDTLHSTMETEDTDLSKNGQNGNKLNGNNA
jgi:hypothetical protein